MKYDFWVDIQTAMALLAMDSDPAVAQHSHWLDVLAASSRANKRNNLEYAFIRDYEEDGRNRFYILLRDLMNCTIDAQGEVKTRTSEGGGKKGTARKRRRQDLEHRRRRQEQPERRR